jgi:hypothetical protein
MQKLQLVDSASLIRSHGASEGTAEGGGGWGADWYGPVTCMTLHSFPIQLCAQGEEFCAKGLETFGERRWPPTLSTMKLWKGWGTHFVEEWTFRNARVSHPPTPRKKSVPRRLQTDLRARGGRRANYSRSQKRGLGSRRSTNQGRDKRQCGGESFLKFRLVRLWRRCAIRCGSARHPAK